MKSDILYICTGHQDQDYKVDYLLEIISKVKNEGGIVCYGTHCDYRLNEIYGLCDHVIYEKNNEYLSEEFLFENCEQISEDSMSNFFNYWYSPNQSILLQKAYISNHSKPCITNIKNVISFAKSNDYKWIVYFEYDSLLPDSNLVNKIEKKIKVLENLNKDGYAYLAEDTRKGLLFPHLFISKVEVFYKDNKFNNSIEQNLDYLKNYSNICPEEILLNIFSVDNFILTSAFNLESDYDYDYDLTQSLKGEKRLSKFDALDALHHKNELDIFKRECKIEFYPSLTPDGFYNIDLWIVKNNESKYVFEYISVTIDETEVLSLKNFTIDGSYTWYCEHVLQNYDLTNDSRELIQVRYQVTLPNSEIFTDSSILKLKHLDKCILFKEAIYS